MAVLTEQSYINESISVNTTVTTVDYYMKIFIATGLSADISLTIPTAGGGAKNGTIIHCNNKDATYNLTVNYGSGLSVKLYPGMVVSFVWNGTAWVQLVKSNYKGAGLILQNDTDYTEFYETGNGAFEKLDNAYYDTGAAAHKFKNNGYAYREIINISSGASIKYVSTESGTAGNTITWAIALSYDGASREFKVNDSTIFPQGLIIGESKFNSSTLPPIIGRGVREVKGVLITDTSDYSMALTDAFGDCSQVLSSYASSWVGIVRNILGEKKYILMHDKTIVASLSAIDFIQVSVTSNVATVSTTNTTGLAVGHVVVLTGSNIVAKGKVTAVTAGVSFQIPVNIADGTYNAGTYTAYYRIATYHGTGSLTGVNTDADIEKYTSSPDFNINYGGYYFNDDGDIDTSAAATWRLDSIFFVNSSNNVTHVRSYKSGKDKNDNWIQADGDNGFGSSATQVMRFINFRKLWGSDYVLTDDSTNSTIIEILNTFTGVLSANCGSGTSSIRYIAISENTTEFTLTPDNMNQQYILAYGGVGAAGASAPLGGNVSSGFVGMSGNKYRFHGFSIATNTDIVHMTMRQTGL